MPKGLYCGRCGGVWKKECTCSFPKSGFPMMMEVKPGTTPGMELEKNPIYVGMGFRNSR
jgi:hypothetical protein